jgi:hypothetical protein
MIGLLFSRERLARADGPEMGVLDESRAMKARVGACGALLALIACALFATPQAQGAEFQCPPKCFGLNNVDVIYTGKKGEDLKQVGPPKGELLTQAGEHPFEMSVSFRANGEENEKGGEEPFGAIRDALFTQMPGFAGAPTAVPTCSTADFLTPNPKNGDLPNCQNSAAVGVVSNELASHEVGKGTFFSAVYNLEPAPGAAAKFGFWTTKIPVTIDANLSEDAPNLIVAGPTNIPQLVEFMGAVFTLWGVPADPDHDFLRGECVKTANGESEGECPAEVVEVPFLTMPRNCDGPLATKYHALSWPPYDAGTESFLPAATDSNEVLTHDEAGSPQGMIGCGTLDFAPHISAQTSARSAASPSGMDIAVEIDDEGLTNPTGIAGSDIRKAVVSFPEGVTINPSQAEGLATCSRAQVDRETAHSPFGAGCPAESKVGSLEVESPLLKEKVFKGSLFVATPYDNLANNSLIALYMVIKEPERGIGLVLPVKVEPDPATGQLVSTVGEGISPIPQLPVSDFRVHLREGARSPLITPNRCATYTTTAQLTPTGAPSSPFEATAGFAITSGVGGGPCPAATPFEPGFSAGTLTNGAGTHSPFLMRLTRRDGDQDLTKFAATLPRGVLASLVGVGKCPEEKIAQARSRTGPHGGAEELAGPSCPADSKIGTTLAGAGVGSQLTYVPGSLYLAGPYNGAPLSVVSVTPGVAGPFDVGTIVVRVALGFDPKTAEVKADGSRSDPIPHILRGIPLAVRDLKVRVDRPNWITNPTSCRESATKAEIFGSATDLFNPADDIAVARSSRFQATDCLKLPFAPQMSLKLKGGTARGDHPALTTTYRAKAGHANVRDLSLLLPRSAFVENANFRTICTRKAFAQNSCPPGSVYGHVTATTPLLEEKLSGPVYLRSSDNQLPDAVLVLHGIIDVEVPIKIDSFHQRLRATVKDAPDAAVSRVVVQMQGARKGLFVNSRNLCAAKNRARVNLTAHSTKRLTRNPVVTPAGCRGKEKH